MSRLLSDTWSTIQEFYKRTFGYPYYITDYVAVEQILKKCCVGYNNMRIARLFKMHEEYVSEVLLDFLYFSGWFEDLSYSPLAVYKENKEFDKFTGAVYNINEFEDESHIKYAFMICKRYEEIRKELEKYGY